MLRNDGALDGRRYLAPHTVALMRTNQVGLLHAADGGLGFGLGFETTERYGANGMSSVGTFSWGGAYGSTYKVDPKERLVICLMVQVVPSASGGIKEAFDTAVYQALRDRQALEHGRARYGTGKSADAGFDTGAIGLYSTVELIS